MPKKEFVDVDFDAAFTKVRGEKIREERGSNTAIGPDDFNTAPTPEELHAIYNRGFQGVKPDTMPPEERNAHRSMMAAMPRLYDIFPWAKGLGKGKVNAPFIAAMKLSPEWGSDEAQARGDCTVHGTANACEIDHANDALWGETAYKGRLCKENIYRSRGFNSDGWSCAAPCRYVGPEGKGGLLYRQVYKDPASGDEVDLSKYNPSWEGSGSRGTPAWMEEISRKNKVKWVIPISDMEEYRDALAMCFGVNVCSGQGFSSSTDSNGLAAASGSWSHSMAHTCCDDTDWAHKTYGDMIGGIQQSWGRWNKQNGKPPGLPGMPVGMFMAKASPISRMISGEDCFAMCSVWGWDRTGWEAFDVTGMEAHLRNSTTQDYYITRAEKMAEAIQEALDTGAFNTAL